MKGQRFIYWFSISFIIFCLSGLTLKAGSTEENEKLINEADIAYSDKSYAKAENLYSQVDMEILSPSQQKLLQFKIIDSKCRNFLSGGNPKNAGATLNKYKNQLEKLIKDTPTGTFTCRIQETLGDYYLLYPKVLQDKYLAWEYYSKVMDYWASGTDLDTAAKNYLRIFWKFQNQNQKTIPGRYRSYEQIIPERTLNQVIKVMQQYRITSPSEELKVHVCLAQAYQRMPMGPDIHYLIQSEYDKILAIAAKERHLNDKTPEGFDQALFDYANWLSALGYLEQRENGNYSYLPDYEKALKIYQKILDEYTEETSPLYKDVKKQVGFITDNQLNLFVNSFFTPDSDIEFSLNARNVGIINISFYPINLNEDIRVPQSELNQQTIWKNIASANGQAVYNLQITNTAKSHFEFSTNIVLSPDLPSGAYLLEAKSDKTISNEIILISDIAAVLRTANNGDSLVYVCDAFTGKPLTNASVRMVRSVQLAEKQYDIKEVRGETDENGLVSFNIPANQGFATGMVTVNANNGKQQTMFFFGRYIPLRESALKYYVFTDRPAYRPEETAYWKTVVRKENIDGYTTPSHEKIKYTLYNPKWEKVFEGEAELNDFGSANGQFELKKGMKLGEYNIEFSNDAATRTVLFRLEEYKLPDYRVSITPIGNEFQSENQGVAYRLGDTVKAKIKVEYFWGGPVSNANIEAQIHSKNYWHRWRNGGRYDWLYENSSDRDFGTGKFQKTEKLTSDSNGEAFILFETPRSAQNDVEYTISADVTDSLQRTISTSTKIIVTKQSYFANITTEGKVHSVGNKIDITLSTQDANKNPKSCSGKVFIQRKVWKEIWVSPDGKTIDGEELIRWKQQIGLENFPPVTESGKRPWKLKFRGFEYENILDEQKTTDKDGKLVVSITPSKCGYYEIKWIGEDWLYLEDSSRIPWSPVQANASLWVGDTKGGSLAIHNDSLSLYLPKSSAEIGDIVPVLIQTDFPGRYVLFTIEAESILHQQVIRMENDSILLNIPVTEAFAPNIRMGAFEVRDRTLFQSMENLLVPQTHKFANIKVDADQSQYQPRDEVTLDIKTTDYAGNPISTEVSLSVIDEAVYSIQEEYAQDPRKFFFGKERSHNVMGYNSFWRNLLRIKNITPPDSEEVFEEMAEFDAGANDVFGAASPSSAMRSRKLYAAPAGKVANEMPEMMQIGRGLRKERVLAGAVAEDMAVEMASMEQMSEPGTPPEVIVVRDNFASTAYCNQSIVTDSNGASKVSFKMPDNITEWRLNTRANSAANHFGMEKSVLHTLQPLMVRLQAPRFFVVGDKAFISALIENSTDQEMTVETQIDFDKSKGLVLTQDQSDSTTVTISPKGSYTQYWSVLATENASARIKVSARSLKSDSGKVFSDAAMKTYPVYTHGIKKYAFESVKLQNESEIQFQLTLPKERDNANTFTQIHLSSSLLSVAKESLPYLLDYPYGTMDLTMNRFLPALALANLAQIEQDTDVLGDSRMKLSDVIQQSLEKVYSRQTRDHGWSWISGSDHTDDYVTAYVLWGLFQAKTLRQSIVNEQVLSGAIEYILKNIKKRQGDLQARMLFSLTSDSASWKYVKELNDKYAIQLENVFKTLYDERESLTTCTRALLTISAISMNKSDESNILAENLENGLVSTADGSMAHWEGNPFIYNQSSVVTTAFALKALILKNPKHPLIQPVVNWIIKNRRGTNWGNSRDTAISLLAFHDFLKYSESPSNTAEYTLIFNDKEIDSGKLNSLSLQVIEIPGDLLRENNSIKLLRKQGKAPIYATATAEYFTTENPIQPAASEIVIDRKYFRIDKVPTLLMGPSEQKIPIVKSESLKSGDQVEVVLTLNARCDLCYLILEDVKPGCLESVHTKSGLTATLEHPDSEGVFHPFINRVYQEQRDRSVTTYIEKLSEGSWILKYRFNVEVPGEFHALPAQIQALYLPECKANSIEQILQATQKNKGN